MNRLFKFLFVFSFAVGVLVSSNGVSQQIDLAVITLSEKNHVLLSGPVTSDSITQTIESLSKLLHSRKADETLYLVLDTPGGDVLAGYKLYEFLRTYKNVSTITITSMSMGAVLVQLLPGERLMLETGTLMLHRMKSSMTYAVVEQAQALIDYMKQLEGFAEERISLRVGISRADLRKKLDAEWFLQGQEAINTKLIDRLITLKCSDELIKKEVTKLVQPIPFLPPMELKVSACPLLN